MVGRLPAGWEKIADNWNYERSQKERELALVSPIPNVQGIGQRWIGIQKDKRLNKYITVDSHLCQSTASDTLVALFLSQRLLIWKNKIEDQRKVAWQKECRYWKVMATMAVSAIGGWMLISSFEKWKWQNDTKADSSAKKGLSLILVLFGN